MNFPEGGQRGRPRQFELECRCMIEGGMTAMEVIPSLTQKAAHLLQIGDKGGALEAGKKAGIVIVEGNPLEDIGRLANIRGVVNGGTLI